VEIDPALVAESRAVARRLGLGERARFVEQDLFAVELGEATVVTLYLSPELNRRLRPRLIAELRPGSRVVSHDFDLGHWQPDRAGFDLARHARSAPGAPLGEVFAFLSGLYFRGKLAYARAFARPPGGLPGVYVITTTEGLRLADEPVDLARLRRFARVDIDVE